MRLGSSLFLIAVGAILYFAVTATLAGIEIQTVGLIFMIIGALGLVISLVGCEPSRDPSRVATTGEPLRGTSRPRSPMFVTPAVADDTCEEFHPWGLF